jgi:hypothetical protein
MSAPAVARSAARAISTSKSAVSGWSSGIVAAMYDARSRCRRVNLAP